MPLFLPGHAGKAPAAASQYLQIYVSDNGIGFNKEASEKFSACFSGCMANQHTKAPAWDWLSAAKLQKTTAALYQPLRAGSRRNIYSYHSNGMIV
jgi:hypothetical protein